MRSIWNGTLSFGLVSIPVKMYSASEERGLDFDMLDKHNLGRIRYKRVNEETGEEVEWKDIVKGHKVDEKYVVLTNEDFEKANVKKSKTIDIEEFVDKDEVAELLFKKPYYLEPTREGAKSYALLRDSLKKTGKVGVATFVLRQKENLCLIDHHENALVLHVIRFADELRGTGELNLPETKANKKEVDMALMLIEQYTEKFKLEKYKDVYTDQLLKIIEAKSKGKRTKKEKYEPAVTSSQDLMAQLKASLQRKKTKAG